MNQKTAPDRDKKYMSFVREHACCGCSKSDKITVHHWAPKRYKAMGRKVSDYRTVPLCPICHQDYHMKGAVGSLSILETQTHFLEVQVRLLVEWTQKNRG